MVLLREKYIDHYNIVFVCLFIDISTSLKTLTRGFIMLLHLDVKIYL